ncbi:MAG: hypothetical protein ACRDCB_04200 [Clostridium sp.]
MNKKGIILEANYEFTYIYEVVNNIKKSIKEELPEIITKKKVLNGLRFSNRDRNLILIVSADKLGVFIDLGKSESEIELINKGIKVFNKAYSIIRQIVDEKEFENININCQYLINENKETVRNWNNCVFKDTIFTNIINTEDAGLGLLVFDFLKNGIKNELGYRVNSDNEIEVQHKKYFDKDLDSVILNCEKEILGSNEEIKKLFDIKE